MLIGLLLCGWPEGRGPFSNRLTTLLFQNLLQIAFLEVQRARLEVPFSILRVSPKRPFGATVFAQDADFGHVPQKLDALLMSWVAPATQNAHHYLTKTARI